MGGVALALAFVLALLPGVLSLPAGGLFGLDAVPWTPLALLPWLALAGLPRARRAATRSLVVVAALLPALALAVARDASLGIDRTSTLAIAGWGTLACWALALAAQRGASAHAVAWWIVVPLAAVFAVARGYVGELAPGSFLTRALGASPLVWALRGVDAVRASPAPGIEVPWGLLAVVAGLVLVGGRGRGDEGSDEEVER